MLQIGLPTLLITELDLHVIVLDILELQGLRN